MRPALKIGAFFAVLAAAGFLVVLSGLIPIKASSGHWAITEWFLQLTKERSVSTHSLFLQVPALDVPGLVVKGAGHYDMGCRPCHGDPEIRSPRIPSKMTPHPPDLAATVSNWKPEELFYIVKHGIKFTGMPAWPAQQRDDEVWAVVAFLMKLPNMQMQEYRRLTRGEVPVKGAETAFESCERCHGLDGRGRGPGAGLPILASQNPTYLYNALQAYAKGERHSGIMEPIAAALSTDSMHEFAKHYGGLHGLSPVPAHEDAAAAFKQGEAIVRLGIPSQRVPACADCHGPGPAPRNPAYPVLSGQHADYLILQLTLLKEERRGGSAYRHLMQEIAPRLTPEQMREVAGYYQWLGSPRP